MNDSNRVRETVSEAYGLAVTRRSSCCGSETAPARPHEMGYDPAELNALPAETVESSFGCGNPLAFAELREGDVVLDLGAGAGIDLLLARQRVGASGRVIGVDMTDEMIDRARAAVAHEGFGNVEVRKGIIEALPVESESVDWVISNCVINLSPEKDRVFAEIARVLKPGGRMLVSDVVAEELPPQVRASAPLYCACVAGAISQEQYLEGLRRAGLTEVAVRERVPYGRAELASLIAGDPALASALTEAGLGLDAASELMEGKVASVRVHARK